MIGKQSPAFARRACRTAFAMAALALTPLDALTLDELLLDPEMTPKRFAALFENFEYDYHPEVKPARAFLASRRGDCDDYAILADYVLGRKNYDTRMIHVRMVGRIAHAVCYVRESKAYLDYNNRRVFFNLQRSGMSLREIATRVADSFEANWTTASEFTYDYGEDRKQFGATVVKTDPRSSDPDITSPRRRPPGES